MRVAGLGYSDGASNLEVMLESGDTGRRNSYGSKKKCIEVFSAIVERDELGEAKCDLVRHADCR